jgi:hypothetical protein
MAKQKSTTAIPLHPGADAQPPGGRGHATGAAPVADGGKPAVGTVHPFEKPASPQLSQGKLAPVAWAASGGVSMRNRNQDALHGGATSASGCETGDPARELGFADPLHPDFRGKRTSSQDCGD